MSKDHFYLTVAIDYSNASPHLGHAYEKVAADAIVRFKKLCGVQAWYTMGTDEHSLNVAKKARSLGLAPKEYCDRMAGEFRRTWESLGIDYSAFKQTSSEEHHRAVQKLITKIYENGHVYRGTYKGWYCVSCEAFYTEKDLVEGKCPVHKRDAEFIEEENYFFRLSSFQQALLDHIESHPEYILPEARRNEILNVLRGGLEDISISRSKVDWGIPLPWDENQVVYVWFDALITYLTGIGYATDDQLFSRYWPADLHLIGKDITRFHCIIWPAMLMAAGLPLPKTVFGHGFLNLRGEKFSKTTGNIIEPAGFAAEYGVDQTRHFLLSEMPFGQDGNFTLEAFIKRVNSDLANDLGNLLSRTTAMIERFCQGEIPSCPAGASDGELRRVAEQLRSEVPPLMDAYRLNEAISVIWRLVRRANKYIDEMAPWELAKDEGKRQRLQAVLFDLAETLRILAIWISPFQVRAPEEIWRQLGLDRDIRSARLEDTAWGGLPAGIRIRRGKPLYPRLEVPADEAQAQPTSATAPSRQQTEAHTMETMDTIDISDFQKLDLRIAQIVSAERLQGADRLLRLNVDLGGEERQVVAGIAQSYAPEDLVGKQVVLLANLKPAKIRGVESQGMILAASDGERLSLVSPLTSMPAGSRVK